MIQSNIQERKLNVSNNACKDQSFLSIKSLKNSNKNMKTIANIIQWQKKYQKFKRINRKENIQIITLKKGIIKLIILTKQVIQLKLPQLRFQGKICLIQQSKIKQTKFNQKLVRIVEN
ncbi:hypothetical protein TTHERM_001351043 (macronuclear) [Tetrahymena thermophila SB210]|uniref:Uncharacterized protein n=1 Tax=Tetrahymena thermophila (strain SB210) TaxID=312017 RepID=W7X7J0_TETTS|nr:hypothetical protein TTHERM_001351043 [Tetrahymena thermophila SB210]EWS73322.1 hypothetical protein TTHERM_001351043 [Tetrahymena thermophila SB210]|eukprot:XP_012654144.1 hypothetical protein TTHERM_001351043 [Tetrahymena thermophila SB210]